VMVVTVINLLEYIAIPIISHGFGNKFAQEIGLDSEIIFVPALPRSFSRRVTISPQLKLKQRETTADHKNSPDLPLARYIRLTNYTNTVEI